MANGLYNRGAYLIGSSDIGAADLRYLLVNDSYVFSKDHNVVDDVVANEITATGYARKTLASVTVTQDDTNDFAYLDAADLVWATIDPGQTIGGGILYVYDASDASASLIAFHAPVVALPTNGQQVTWQWATPENGGVLKLVQG